MPDNPANLGRIALRAAQAYHDRRQIEISFRTVKQEFAPEKARVRTFRRLENIFTPCILAYVFATDHLRKVAGFGTVMKLLSDISGRPRKDRPPDRMQLLPAF